MLQQQTLSVGDEGAVGLVSACRATIGDRLRSLTYFTRDDHRQLYLRADLEADADLAGFVDHECGGFAARTAYRGSEIGDYRFTIRAFEGGFLVRVLGEDDGVFLTTDGLTLRAFDEVATVLASLLAR